MNKRADEMWEQMVQYVDFKGKSVVDLGCGTGDFLLRSLRAGSAWVIGVDVDAGTAKQAVQTCKEEGYTPVVVVDDIVNMPADASYDIALCLSVLPYVSNQVTVLKWMRSCAKQSIIEMQYANDGPGPRNIIDDLDMLNYLNLFWDNPVVIGHTHTKIRPAERTIWLCQN